jgi:hypothetical protein
MTRISKMTNGDLQLFMKAMEEYYTQNCVTTVCDVCNNPLFFKVINEDVTFHNCDCGKFEGYLKR